MAILIDNGLIVTGDTAGSRFEPGGLNVRAMAILEVGVRGFEVLDPAPSRLGLGS